MINKNLFASIFLSVLLTFSAFAAGSSDSGSSKTKTQYDMAVSHINAAKKFEQKDKLDKAKKRYKKAQKLLIQSNEKFPNKAKPSITTTTLGTKLKVISLIDVAACIIPIKRPIPCASAKIGPEISNTW